MTAVSTTLKIDKVMIDRQQASKINHFTGLDFGERTGSRRARRTASPEFMVTIMDLEGDTTEHTATVVANNVPEAGNVLFGEPVAIAAITIEDTEWLMLLTRGTNDIEIGDLLISYGGEYEELFKKTHLFDAE